MSKTIVFYDIPMKAKGKAWSPNAWKTRYCLNIKGLPYKTVWVEFPDIAPLCKKLGAPGSETRRDGTPSYTIPFIYDPTTQRYVAGSDAIARYLDKTYPGTPRVVPKDTEALHGAFAHAFSGLLLGRDMLSVMVPAVHDALNVASQPYFRRTRERRFGKLEELAPAGSEKRAKHWQGVKSAFHTIAGWMAVDGEEVLFLGGDRVCQADLGVAGYLMWIRAIFGEDSAEWKDVLTWDGGRWARFTEVFKRYEAVDSGTVAKL